MGTIGLKPWFLVAVLGFFLCCGGDGEKRGTSPQQPESDRGISLVKTHGTERIALVIGNGSYRSAALKNPVNDARDMAELLGECGFEVLLHQDVGHQEMESAIRNFGKKIAGSGVGLFFYAGHGMQVKGTNYLIPVDADIQSEDEIKFKAVDANFVLGKMESAENGMNILILDACRDNPFARSFRSGTRGLARMDAPRGSLIVYSTSPGKTASDGPGRNGIFTKHLIGVIRDTDLEIGHLLREVRKKVIAETDGIQVPWESSSLMDDFYFSPAETEMPPPPRDIDVEKLKQEDAWHRWQQKMSENVEKLKALDRELTVSNQTKSQAWNKLLADFGQDNPYSRDDEELRQYIESRIRHWETVTETRPKKIQKEEQTTESNEPVTTKPEKTIRSPFRLRSRYRRIPTPRARAILKRFNFYDSAANRRGNFKNVYRSKVINGDRVVIDRASGLMWHQSGSPDSMVLENARKWLKKLNRNGYAGFHDWRLPTLEEGATLVEDRKASGDLHIDPVFSPLQRHLWTGDFLNDQRFYVILFNYKGKAGLFTYPPWLHVSVRPVRSLR